LLTQLNLTDDVYYTGQVFSQNLAQIRNQAKTGEGNPHDDDSYLGYSVTVGEFDGNPASTDTAVGMPRGDDLRGKVRTKIAVITLIIGP